jgi:phosphodiesterase/alkaline phosphatase D-like protein
MSKLHISRRELIVSATATGAFAAVPPAWGKAAKPRRARVGPGAFRDGVATGEPSTTAVTFWSRLTTGRPRSGARLVVARDAGMRKVEATAVVPTGRALNGSLKARIGGLDPAREYFYCWESGTDVSPIGRTRTAPPRDSNQPVRIAFSSCQQYARGFFGAHADAAALQDVDLYLFLGDYIYERGVPGGDIRVDPIWADSLRSYRRKYELYRSDDALRELHRSHPTAHIWDDHEIANNYSNRNPHLSPAQRQAGYRAAFEWLPRMTYARDRHRIYKRLSYGRMADVFLLDERQYRTGEGDGQPRRMLGDGQMSWLIDGLRRSRARWKIIAQQVRVAPFGPGGRNMDAWAGYPEDRVRLLSAIEAAGIQNVVFLTGDQHVFMASVLSSDFEEMAEGRRRGAATEYLGGSVTSPGADRDENEVRSESPWIVQYNGLQHGYARMDLSDDALVMDYVACDVANPGAPSVPFERLVQPVNSSLIERHAPPPAARRDV